MKLATLRTHWATALIMAYAISIPAQDLFRRGKPFDLQIVGVRSIAPERRLGLGKSTEIYAVDAKGQQMAYVLYCAKTAPESGKTYTALDEYASAGVSFLHLWPVEKSSLDLPPKANKKGRLYRVVVIENVVAGQKSDVACDIYSEKPQLSNQQ